MGKPNTPRPRTVCCAIPIWREKGKILLVTSRKRPNQWILPKGGYELSDPSLEATACREALEEAGVHGQVTAFVVKVPTPSAVLHVFELDVTGMQEQWLESGERKREWVDYAVAFERIAWKPELTLALSMSSMAPKR